jgi:hypothetical protein
MAKKRKTLPKNFDELIKAKDIAALKAVYDACEINAYEGFDKSTALHAFDVPDELVRWLVEQGADINARNHSGQTPLYAQAGWQSGNIAILIELGADINTRDNYTNTPLHNAARKGNIQTVKELVAFGMDVNVEDRHSETPLSHALSFCQNIDISNIADVAEFLLNAGTKITPKMAICVERIGKEFEFFRADFNKNHLNETETGLTKLYTLFNVTPVPRRKTHDGKSPITVPEGKLNKQHEALWQLLVPGQGQALTLQGEVIRLSGKLAREIMENGGINWGDEFQKMLFALVEYFGRNNPLPPGELAEAEKIAKRLKNGNGDDEPERLMELAVHWVKANPNPIPLGKTEYKW